MFEFIYELNLYCIVYYSMKIVLYEYILFSGIYLIVIRFLVYLGRILIVYIIYRFDSSC